MLLDEAHGMLVNKDLKTTVVREYLDRIFWYYLTRSHTIKNLRKEVLLDTEEPGAPKVHLQHFESYVRYQILREPSAKVPQRRLKQLIKKGSEQVCTEANCMADEDRRGSTVSR